MQLSSVVLAAGWVLWCCLHSLLISQAISRRIQSRLGRFRYHYRLLYNVTAFVTLLPLSAATALVRGEVVFSWQGPWIGLQLVLIIISLWLYHDGAKHYDIGYLLGLRQIRNRKQHATLAENGLFTREGAHGMMRHPLYSGSFLFIWSVLPVYHLSSFIAATVLSVYLVVGTWLEERKILAEYGVQYRRYQQEVSMLIPWKWLLKKLRGK